jgi:hypothetical protein
MKTSTSIRLLAAIAAVLGAQSGHAVTLASGATASLPGTTVAVEPQLAGSIIEDKLFSFSMLAGAGSVPGTLLVTGQVQSRVVRSSLDGTLDFYWRVTNDANSQADVAFFRIGLFDAPEYNANYRIDGVGDRAPVTAHRFTTPYESYVNFDFTTQGPTGGNVGLKPGESSNFMLLDTSATTYAETATMDVADFGTYHESQSFATFTPAAVPEPQTYSLIGFGLLAIALKRRRQ